MKSLLAAALITLTLAGCAPKTDDTPLDVNHPKQDAAEKIAHGEKVNPSDVTPK